MRFFQLTLFTLLTTHGLAAPTTQKPGTNSLTEADPLIEAGKTPPFNPLWHYCQLACRCDDLKGKDGDGFFQCVTNPICEQCARVGMKKNPHPA